MPLTELDLPVHPSKLTVKTMAAEPYRRLAHIPALDGLRGIAVLLVLAAHFPYIQGFWLSKAFWSLAQAGRAGYIGVDIFFVLSGFLITRLLLRERTSTGTISLFDFYARRSLRIFPIYYLCIAATIGFFPTAPGAMASLLAYGFNYYHAFNPAPYPLEHTWSLAVEEQFYLVWPFVMMCLPLHWGRRLTGAILPGLAILAAMLMAATLEPVLAASLIYASLPTRMLSLSFGAYIAFREADGARLSAWVPLSIAAAGVAALGLDSAGRTWGMIPPGGWYWCIALPGYSLVGFGIVAFLTLGEKIGWFSRLLSWSVLRFVGRISYGLYLYHLVVLFFLALNPARVEDGASWPRVLTALVVSFAISIVSYFAIEQPLLRLKARFARVATIG